MHGSAVGIFIAGVQKGGTTSLHSYFEQHPELLSPRKKETHFFDREDRVNWIDPDYDYYHRTFFPAADGKRRPYDATPIYLFWPPSLARIRAYNSSAKFVVLFRDPVERAYSNWCMEFARGAETLPFSAAIREGRWRMRGLAELHPIRRSFSYVERGFYGYQVRRALEHFDRGQFLFLRSDALRDRPAEILDRIAHFLHIGLFPDTQPRRVFARAEVNYPSALTPSDEDYLRSVFSDDIRELQALTGLDLCDWLPDGRGVRASER